MHTAPDFVYVREDAGFGLRQGIKHTGQTQGGQHSARTRNLKNSLASLAKATNR